MRCGVVECCSARARGKGGGAVGVAGEHLAVGPFGLQGPVQALDLAVLPGAVRLDELLPGPELGDDLAQRLPVDNGPGTCNGANEARQNWKSLGPCQRW